MSILVKIKATGEQIPLEKYVTPNSQNREYVTPKFSLTGESKISVVTGFSPYLKAANENLSLAQIPLNLSSNQKRLDPLHQAARNLIDSYRDKAKLEGWMPRMFTYRVHKALDQAFRQDFRRTKAAIRAKHKNPKGFYIAPDLTPENVIYTIGFKLSDDLQLDQIDQGKGYFLGNVRWLPGPENLKNRRSDSHAIKRYMRIRKVSKATAYRHKLEDPSAFYAVVGMEPGKTKVSNSTDFNLGESLIAEFWQRVRLYYPNLIIPEKSMVGQAVKLVKNLQTYPQQDHEKVISAFLVLPEIWNSLYPGLDNDFFGIPFTPCLKYVFSNFTKLVQEGFSEVKKSELSVDDAREIWSAWHPDTQPTEDEINSLIALHDSSDDLFKSSDDPDLAAFRFQNAYAFRHAMREAPSHWGNIREWLLAFYLEDELPESADLPDLLGGGASYQCLVLYVLAHASRANEDWFWVRSELFERANR